MNNRKKAITVIGVTVFILFLFLGSTFLSGNPEDEGNGIISLIRPALVDASGDDTSFLETQAGITAYVFVEDANINIGNIKSHFNTIEKETDDYIIGSVTPNGYDPGSHDVHVYISKDGWFVSYISKEETPSFVIDWKNYTINNLTTTLHNVLSEILQSEFHNDFIDQIQMYDFSNPHANKFMLIVDESEFFVTIPAGVTLYKASGSIIGTRSGSDDQSNYLYTDIANNKFQVGDSKHFWNDGYRLRLGDELLLTYYTSIAQPYIIGIALVYREPS